MSWKLSSAEDLPLRTPERAKLSRQRAHKAALLPRP
jgi:hypothetical protein